MESPVRTDALCGVMEPSYGAPEFTRIWATAAPSTLSPCARRDLYGWPVAWADQSLPYPVPVDPADLSSPRATRVELTLFLTTEARWVPTVELADERPREFASSPPDLWVTHADELETIDAVAAWLEAIRQTVVPGVPWPMVDEVVRRATAAMPAVTPA